MKIAVLGTGSMGKTHASIYKTFKEIDSVIIVGRDQSKTKEIAKTLGVQAGLEMSGVLQDESFTAVDVCLPTEIHKEFVTSALEKNKHVFCEIPVSYDLVDALEMVQKSKAAKKVFQVAQLMRSLAEVEYVAKKIKSGELGKVLSVHLHRYQRYKVPEPIIDLMGFEIDIANFLLGVPTSVRTTRARKDTEEFFGLLNYPDLSCLVEFKTIMSKEFPLSHGVRVVGSEGIIETNTVFTSSKPSIPETSVVFYPKGGKKQQVPIKGYDPYEHECRYFIDTILGKVDGDILDANNAVNTLKIATTVKKSLATNKEVSL